MIDKEVHFISHRFGHHASHSGYDSLTHYIGSVIRVRPLSPKIIRNRIMWKIANGVIGYDRASLATEIKASRKILTSKHSVFHILYGENTYHYLGLFNNWRNNRLIMSVHLPIWRYKEAVQINWHIRQLSAIICVGRTQMAYFSKLLDEDRVFFVPHGIDTDYFTPPSSFEIRDPNLVLFVGSHLRDLATLRGVIELVAFQNPKVKFVVVTAQRNFELVGIHPNLTLRTQIPEDELLRLYQSAAVLLMPLQDTTANNAVLEGIACGTPTIVTDVGSIRDYVNPECAILIPPHKSQEMAQAVLDLLHDYSYQKKLSENARQQALQFSWPTILPQLKSIYTKIA
ncbi:MAG: glycosyltransferase family 4 protein [Chloroflexi bacterium]|nr:glycosyltransferase family 4 protein [Chloroflexota bacterium]